jgi:hypothetical protein
MEQWWRWRVSLLLLQSAALLSSGQQPGLRDQLAACAATLPDPALEQVSLAIAGLFQTYIAYDAQHWNITAASLAAFRHHHNVTLQDTQDAKAMPVWEQQELQNLVQRALLECQRVAQGGYRPRSVAFQGPLIANATTGRFHLPHGGPFLGSGYNEAPFPAAGANSSDMARFHTLAMDV